MDEEETDSSEGTEEERGDPYIPLRIAFASERSQGPEGPDVEISWQRAKGLI